MSTIETPAGPGPSSAAAANNQGQEAPGSAKKRKRILFTDAVPGGGALEQEILDAPRKALMKVEGAATSDSRPKPQ